MHDCKVCGAKIATLGRILVTTTEYPNDERRPTTETKVVCSRSCLERLFIPVVPFDIDGSMNAPIEEK